MIANVIRQLVQEGWSGRWAAFDEFVRHWCRVDLRRRPDDPEIDAMEQTFDIVLPPSAREWCAFALAAEQLGDSFLFRDAFVVEPRTDYEAVTLLMQGEGDFAWGIESRFLDQDDPPMTAFPYDELKLRYLSREWAPTVSSFAFEYLLTYLQSDGGSYGTLTSSSLFSRESLSADLGPPISIGHLELFLAENVLAVTSPVKGNWYTDVVKVQLRAEMPFQALPNSIRELLPHAFEYSGNLAKMRR